MFAQACQSTRGAGYRGNEGFCNPRALQLCSQHGSLRHTACRVRQRRPAAAASSPKPGICCDFVHATSPSGAHAHWPPLGVRTWFLQLSVPRGFCGIGFSGIRRFFPLRRILPTPAARARTSFRSCGAGAGVSLSPRSGGGCVPAGRTPGCPRWRGRGWRWTAGSWKG